MVREALVEFDQTLDEKLDGKKLLPTESGLRRLSIHHKTTYIRKLATTTIQRLS